MSAFGAIADVVHRVFYESTAWARPFASAWHARPDRLKKILTLVLQNIFLSHPAHRGRLHETFDGWSRVRRLLLRLVTAAPGGLGSPSAPTMGGCLQWLDAARTKGGESCLDRGARRPPSAPGSTAPGTEIAAVERREARVRRHGGARLARRVGRLRKPPGVRAPRAPRSRRSAPSWGAQME